MSSLTPASSGADTAQSVLPDRPAQARRSSQRTRRLTEYIQAHTGKNIEVVLTSHVQTACVLPADADRLIDADATDFDQQAAQQLVDAVDGDYLVLISTNPANLDNLPLDDQLTADRAQQFGLSLHELGHIRYTNISTVADHLDERVDEEYQEFVHGLINYAEDAAIEHQLRAAQSQLAADRLELVNRSLTQMASDLPDTATITFTYRDAIQSYLYDHGIYDSGKSDVLLDPDDPRITFQSQDDAAAFAQTQNALDDLLATVLSEPDSVKRGDAVLDCWEQTIKPLLNQMDEDNHQQGQKDEDTAATGGSSPNTPPSPSQSDSSTPDECEQGESFDPSADTDAETPDESPEDAPSEDGAADADPSDVSESPTSDSPETSGDTPNGEQGESPADGDPSEASSDDASAEPPADFDPENVSLEQTQDGLSTDVLAYPDIGTADTADELATDDAESTDVDVGAASETASDVESDAEPNPQAESMDTSPDEGESDDPSDESGTDASGADSVDGERDSGVGASSGDDLESTSDEVEEPAAEESGIEEQGDGKATEGAADSSGASDASSAPSNGQASLSHFLGGDRAERTSGEAASTAEEATPDGSDTSDTSDTTGGDAAGGTDGGDTDATENESTGTAGEDEADIDSDTLDGPTDDGTVQDGEMDNTGKLAEEAAAPLAEPAYDDSLDERADALSTDHDAAHEEADRATPDQDALERDLEETVAALEDLANDGDTDESPDTTTARRRGGAGAEKGSLDSLSILPQIGEQAPPARWQAATAGADAVGGTLRMALRESRRDQTRSGVTSGSFDRRRAGALARGDVDAFSVRQQGDEKQYDLVLVLDRSSSMSNLIDTAEDAVARFALACEDLGINVAIMDFVYGDARLIKPFSVETDHVQASLMSGETAGGTPLTDALGLARRLLDQRRDSPLVIIITDGKPGSADDYQQELQQTYAPVCGLTLALDTPHGQAPERAKDVEQFYDRHLYVHDAADLDRRLDQFAVMFDGL
ncbi:VWA domain-containing protein [Halobellus rufus]|uniref:VWA domain-containing protein n=1 Tax=Halobellus rufus TaxID=1448860 RepID=UPI000679131D|nr:VWA domain-containing protein [Halobellus rufus]